MIGAHKRANEAGRLLERDAQLTNIEDLLDRTQTGAGGMIVIEGAAGLGKSRLLEQGVQLAAERGFRSLAARGEELEQGLPWGLARRLLGPELRRLRAAGRSPLEGGAEAAAPLFDRSTPTLGVPPADTVLAASHALFWLIANISEAGPLQLIVDDAQWVDRESLQLLAYLLGRLGDLPVAVLLARRSREPGIERRLLEGLAGDPRVIRLSLEPLSEDAIELLVRDGLGERAGPGLPERCASLTGGNPFYLHELLLELGSQPETTLDSGLLDHVAPEAVSRVLFMRLARLEPAAAAFARAVVVLGDGATFPHVCELAGLDAADATRAFDALAKAEILRAVEPLGFVHPLVAQALDADLGAGERGELHRAAARLLDRADADPEAIALHLIEAGRRGDPWVVETLRAASARALAQGATEAAADWLSRALEEPPGPAQRGPLLVELGRVEAALGRPGAGDHLEAAAKLATGSEEQARAFAELGRALAVQGRAGDAAAAFERGLECLQEPGSELGKELRTSWWSVATMDPERRDDALRASPGPAPAEDQRPTPGGRDLLAQLAIQRAFAGCPRDEVIGLAERAWDGGKLLAQGSGDDPAWSLVAGALLVADELERELEICDAALADARRRGSPMAFANASYTRAWPLLAQGRVSDSIADAQAAHDARQDGWSAFLGTAAAVLTIGLLERGELDAARQTLALVEDDDALQTSTQYPLILLAAGRLLIAEGSPEQALQRLLGAGELLTRSGIVCPSAVPWRADAALAATMAGDRPQALRLAEESLAASRRGGAPIAVARALRAAARAERGERAIELHRKAVTTLEGLPPRLERSHALVDLGAALRRSRRRAEAREFLRQGLEQAEAGGALALAETARVELAAAGARATKEPVDGIAALTPSERRVAAMAAAGQTNRAIAQALFVTVKAVEYHLANTYRKLDIRSRTELGPLLDEGDR